MAGCGHGLPDPFVPAAWHQVASVEGLALFFLECSLSASVVAFTALEHGCREGAGGQTGWVYTDYTGWLQNPQVIGWTNTGHTINRLHTGQGYRKNTGPTQDIQDGRRDAQNGHREDGSTQDGHKPQEK